MAELRCGDIVADRFRVGKLIGSGANGEVFTARDSETGAAVALKVEEKVVSSSLSNEAAIYDVLQQGTGRPIHGFARKIAFGRTPAYSWMAMDKMGMTLEDVVDENRERCAVGLPIEKVLNYGVQLLRRLQLMHSRGVIHRDIKPSNIALELHTSQPVVVLIDFGLATLFVTTQNNHVPYCESKSFVGTRRFGSVNAHHGRSLSRRDDLESLAYTLAYVLRGRLPWMGIKARTRAEKHRITLNLKERVCANGLFRDPRLSQFYNYVKSLGFMTEPNYQYLVDIFLS